jgi:hypothetical protein
MASPSYKGNGGLAYSAAGSISVAYPTLAENDILIIQVLSDDDDTHNAVADFTKVTQLAESTACSASWYWKRATGSESGNITVTKTNADGLMVGVMSAWQDCVEEGTPYEQQQENSGDGVNSVSSSSITPVTNDNRVVCLICVEDNTYTGILAGGNYAADYELPSSDGTDSELAAESFPQETAANEPARTGICGNDNWVTFTFALLPVPSAVTYTKTSDLDAILRGTKTKSADLDAVLRWTITSTLDVDALLKLVVSSAVDVDAILKRLGLTSLIEA